MTEEAPPLPPRLDSQRAASIRPDQLESSRFSAGSSLYTCIHEDQICSVESNKPLNSLDRTSSSAATSRTEIETKVKAKTKANALEKKTAASNTNGCAIPSLLWSICHAIVVIGFAVACVSLRLTRKETHCFATWTRLVFHVDQLNLCPKNEHDSAGCLESVNRYSTTGQYFGPLITDEMALHSKSDARQTLSFYELKNELDRTRIVFNLRAVYRIFAQVTFYDKTKDMPVEVSIQVNGTNWIHCEQSNLAGADVTRCIVYGTRKFEVGEYLTFICADKFRTISVASNETFFYIERISA